MAVNPYELRDRALREKLELYEVGRVLLHLNQRRGFLSNRKTDKAKKKETEGMLAEINELAGLMDKAVRADAGQLFCGTRPGFGRPDGRRAAYPPAAHKARMYEDEFDKIWAAQQTHYPEILTEKLKYGVRGRRRFPRNRSRWAGSQTPPSNTEFTA